MIGAWALTNRFGRFAATAALAIGVVAGSHSPARSQQVVVFVNGEPITTLDVDRRIKLTEISTHKAQSRQEALDELTVEKLKLQEAKKWKVEITDKEVDTAFGTMARRAGATTAQFTEALTKAGIEVSALKRRIKADIEWSQIVRGRFPSIQNVAEPEVNKAMEERKVEGKEAYQYTLRPLLFIVPHGSPPTLVEARVKEAEALRARFQNCEEGLSFARALRDVAVRDPYTRTSFDFGVQQREVLDGTPVGHLTPPEVSQSGVETFAVCAKKPTGGDTIGKHQVREEMIGERFQAQAKRYLQELRSKAIIEPSY